MATRLDLPRDDLVRAVYSACEYRDDGDEGATLFGHPAVFDTWTTIESFWEGSFLERIARGAFKKTIRENRDQIKVLLNHGRDPELGDRPLGAIDTLREDSEGLYYEASLFEGIPPLVLSGLRANAYGASFRFRVMKEEVEEMPEVSEHNPKGLPERTIREVRLWELGPVTWGAYPTATSAVRSLTDEYLWSRLADDPERLQGFLARAGTSDPVLTFDFARTPSMTVVPRDLPAPVDDDERDDDDPALSAEEPAAATPDDDESRELDPPADADAPADDPVEEIESDVIPVAEATPEKKEINMAILEDLAARRDEIKLELATMQAEHSGEVLPDSESDKWERLEIEFKQIVAAIKEDGKRRSFLKDADEDRPGPTEQQRVGGRGAGIPANIYATDEYRSFAPTHADLPRLYRDGAMRALEIASFPHADANKEDVQTHVARLLDVVDTDGSIAKRILDTGSPAYRRGFGKTLVGLDITNEERAALGISSGAIGNFAVPFVLDPTIIPTSNGSVNPLRAISRVETIVGNEWQGVSSAGITASYDDEAAEVSDDSPTLGQPKVNVEKAQAFVQFSIEVGQDWGSLQSDIARLLQEAKDDLEADKFLTGAGHGSNAPEGLLVGATSTVVTAASTAFSVGDVYALDNQLGARFQARARFIGHRATYNRIRQFDTSGGASLWERLGPGLPSELIGYPAHEASFLDSGLVAGDLILVLGDFSYFLIVDRVGLNVELVPHMFATGNNRPSGQRGLYAYWRNSSEVLSANAFRVLEVKS